MRTVGRKAVRLAEKEKPLVALHHRVPLSEHVLGLAQGKRCSAPSGRKDLLVPDKIPVRFFE